MEKRGDTGPKYGPVSPRFTCMGALPRHDNPDTAALVLRSVVPAGEGQPQLLDPVQRSEEHTS